MPEDEWKPCSFLYPVATWSDNYDHVCRALAQAYRLRPREFNIELSQWIVDLANNRSFISQVAHIVDLLDKRDNDEEA